jgi:hypothetical protein
VLVGTTDLRGGLAVGVLDEVELLLGEGLFLISLLLVLGALCAPVAKSATSTKTKMDRIPVS